MRQLTHAYDHCRANIDWDNTKHLACSQIRGFHLSGHCAFKNRSIATNSKEPATYEDCLKTSVFEEISKIRNLPERDIKKAIQEVFPKCVSDTSPF